MEYQIKLRVNEIVTEDNADVHQMFTAINATDLKQVGDDEGEYEVTGSEQVDIELSFETDNDQYVEDQIMKQLDAQCERYEFEVVDIN